MSVEENKTIVRGWFAAGNGDLDAARELLAPNFVSRMGSSEPIQGFEGWKQFAAMFRAAFPDFQVTIDDLIGEGDKVVARWTARGTHQGTFQGIPATGKQVTMMGINIIRFEGGKVVEDQGEFDALGMMQQLGVVPPPGQGGE